MLPWPGLGEFISYTQFCTCILYYNLWSTSLQRPNGSNLSKKKMGKSQFQRVSSLPSPIARIIPLNASGSCDAKIGGYWMYGLQRMSSQHPAVLT